MIWENTLLLFRLFYRPFNTMSRIIDEGHWLFGAVLVISMSVILQWGITSRIYNSYEHVASATTAEEIEAAKQAAQIAAEDGEEYDWQDFYEPRFEKLPLPLVGNAGWYVLSFEPSGFFSVLAGLMILYVPATIIVMLLLEPMGSFGVVFRRDYGTLLTCTLMAWAAGHLPFALLGLAGERFHIGARLSLAIWAGSALLFGFFMVCAIRTVFGVKTGKAILTVCIAWTSLIIQPHLFAVVSPLFFSPFILIYAVAYFRGDIGAIGFSLRQRQNFRRYLESATINPRDAEAHYQLGLVYQQRRQYSEAIERFTKAIEIDPSETDAHFQLGRIAREQNRLQQAIEHFGKVVEQNEKHSHSEIWREIGASYVAAGMYNEAREPLERYVERRSYDPEGLFYYGKTLEKLGFTSLAHEMFTRCIEAVQTTPAYHRRQVKRWSRQAREMLKEVRPEAVSTASAN